MPQEYSQQVLSCTAQLDRNYDENDNVNGIGNNHGNGYGNDSEHEHDHDLMSMLCADRDVQTQKRVRTIWSQVGVLMDAVMNRPEDVLVIRDMAMSICDGMGELLQRWAEIGRATTWIQMRLPYVGDVLDLAQDKLNGRLQIAEYICKIRSAMDVCSRGGVGPTRPAGCSGC